MQIDLSELTAANDTRKECKVPIYAAVFSFQKEEYPADDYEREYLDYRVLAVGGDEFLQLGGIV